MMRSIPLPDPFAAPYPARYERAHMTPAAVAFLERLRRLPLGVWADAAARLDDEGGLATDDGVSTPVTDAARARLRQLVDRTPTVAARVRRRVHDLVAVAQGFLHPREVARMKKAALTAALAVHVRPALRPDEFARLYAPFAALVPLETLDAPVVAGAARWRDPAGPELRA